MTVERITEVESAALAHHLDNEAAHHAQRAGHHLAEWVRIVSQIKDDDRKLWKALGFTTWVDYLEERWQMSKPRWYQLQDWLNSLQQLALAAGKESTVVDLLELTERELRPLKPQIDEIAENIRGKVAEGMEPVEAIKSAVIEAQRAPTPAEADEIASDYNVTLEASDGYLHGPETGRAPLRPEITMPAWNGMKMIYSVPVRRYVADLPKNVRPEVLNDARQARTWLHGLIEELER